MAIYIIQLIIYSKKLVFVRYTGNGKTLPFCEIFGVLSLYYCVCMSCCNRSFTYLVFVGRNFAAGPRWLPGTVLECEGNTAVQIKMDDGRIWRRHLDHVILSEVPEETGEQTQPDSAVLPPENDPLTAPAEHAPTTDHDSTSPEQVVPQQLDTEPEGLRRSTRDRQPPHRYK